MAVDYFLIDGPTSVPAEFKAWEAAQRQWKEVFDRYVAAALADDAEAAAALNLEGQVLGQNAERLMQIARQTWIEKTKVSRQ